jgi:nucleoside permease NupC
VGGALGLAVQATLSSSRSTKQAALGDSVAQSLTTGYHMAFTVGAALIVAAALVAAVVLRPARTDVTSEDILVPATCRE